jgi:hypothetical protein
MESAFDELESLVAQRNEKKIDNQQFNSRVASVIRDASKRWKQQKEEGSFDEEEYTRTRQKIGDVITIMNSPGRVAAFAALQGADWLDEDTYAQGVRLAIEYTFAYNDKMKQDKETYTDEAKKTFNAGLKEISKMLDQLPVDVRKKALSGMSDDLTKRVIGTLPPAQQLRIKRELIEMQRSH